jgi:hypothetical protein
MFMPEPSTPNRIRCGDVKRALRIHSDLLSDVEATLREIAPALDAAVLRDGIRNGPVPIDPHPIIMGKGCQVRLPISELDDTTVAGAIMYMRAMLQLPWAILSALPDDHLFELPPVIEPLGLPTAAGEAQG